MKKIIINLTMMTAMLLLLVACQESGPLLKGTAKFIGKHDFVVNYTPDGHMLNMQPYFLQLDEDGNFTFDAEMPYDFMDVEVVIDENVYGVHLEKGKTSVLNIVETSAGKYACSFAGDNADISELMSAAFAAYDLYAYSGPDGNHGMTVAEARAKLDKAHEATKAKLQLIDDEEQREWYAKRIDDMHKATTLRLIEDQCYQDEVDPADNEEYQRLIDSIDPNSEFSLLSANVIVWVSKQCKSKLEFGGNAAPNAMEIMDIVDGSIINEHTKKFFAYYVPNMFFTYGDHISGKEEFWARYKEFAKNYPDYIKAYEQEYKKEVQAKDDIVGTMLPDIELTKPDGSKVKLSSLYGKYTYIDVWATWCGPCCKEIPHLEELVKKMAGKENLQFVSFSVDDDLDAWHNKLDKDKPEWQQFVLDGEANKEFSAALNIQGIPRFVLLDPEGKIVDPDAKRPSDKKLEEELNSL
ncbi:MAG: TlpA family protein disulfide reductase [Prevotellaceae bacterium]|nr:TlpA family protein disulfide reductase [Candidatus Minthosoma caballi]